MRDAKFVERRRWSATVGGPALARRLAVLPRRLAALALALALSACASEGQDAGLAAAMVAPPVAASPAAAETPAAASAPADMLAKARALTVAAPRQDAAAPSPEEDLRLFAMKAGPADADGKTKGARRNAGLWRDAGFSRDAMAADKAGDGQPGQTRRIEATQRIDGRGRTADIAAEAPQDDDGEGAARASSFTPEDIMRRLRQLSRQARQARQAETTGAARLAVQDGDASSGGSPFGVLPPARDFARVEAAAGTEAASMTGRTP